MLSGSVNLILFQLCIVEQHILEAVYFIFAIKLTPNISLGSPFLSPSGFATLLLGAGLYLPLPSVLSCFAQ